MLSRCMAHTNTLSGQIRQFLNTTQKICRDRDECAHKLGCYCEQVKQNKKEIGIEIKQK